MTNDELYKIIRELFEYRDGHLWWKEKPANNVDILKPAGWIDYGTGYRRIGIKGSAYKSSRMIFLYHYAYLPVWPLTVDHINRIRLDDRIENLREATMSVQRENRDSHGTSKYPGVSKHRDKWRVRIRIEGKQKHLGLFEDEEEAAEVYRIAEDKYRCEFV